MTNEAILADISGESEESILDSERIYFGQDTVLDAMDAARKDEAIAFHLWTQRGDCDWSLNDEDDWQSTGEPNERITTEQLYQLFKHKPMDKRIEDYLHLYLGCEVEDEDERASTLKLMSVGVGGYHATNGRTNVHRASKYCKPILRPLSDITDKHINELWEAVGYNTEYESPAYPGMTKRKFLKRVFEEHEDEQRIEITFETAVVMQNLLRKNGYDCDGLIDAGLAIDKTKLETNG